MPDRGWDIAFFASSLVSSYWNGAATYYRGLVRALAERGHRIRFFEPDAFGRQQHRDMVDPEWVEVVVYQPQRSRARAALNSARSADLLIKASGVGVLDEWLEREVPRSAVHAALFWDVDAPATLARLDADPRDPFHRDIPCYDLVLSYGGGAAVVDAYRALGARDCVPIYNALDPASHYPVPAEPEWEAQLSLLANRLPDREARIEEFFFKPVRDLPGQRFILGGSGWEDRMAPYPNLDYAGHVYSNDHNRFNCSARAVLNVNRESMARTGFSPPTRIFEAAGAGACLISDRWHGLEAFLEPNREILVADNGEDVTAFLHQLDQARARRIGRAARQRVLAEHCYSHRARQFEAVIDGLSTTTKTPQEQEDPCD